MITIKNERGITLIAVVLTIVIMLILTTITVKTGIGSIEESRMISFVSKMQLLQKKVDFLAENGGYEDIGESLESYSESKMNEIEEVFRNENIDTTSLQWIPRVLPSDYQEVEYIKMDETNPYKTFLTTNIKIDNISKIDVKYAFANVVDYNPMIFSAYTSSSTNSTTPWVCVNGEKRGTWTVSPTTDKSLINTPTKYNITCSDTSTNLLKIGGWSDSYWTAVGQYYYVKIYNKSYQLVGDFVPCYRKADNVVGMYNLVNETFYTNSGAEGNFSCGIDATKSKLRYFNSKSIANDLGIDNIDDEIIVDFATRQIVSLNGIEYEGKMHYSQYNLPGGQKVKQGEEEVRQLDNVSITPTINGLNATWTISGIKHTNGTLSYSRNNKETWTQITNYTIDGEDVTTENITQSGTYYFKWVDNTNKNNEYILDVVELRLVNSPQLKGDLELVRDTYNYSYYEKISSDWAYAEANEKEYVWIPRFAYKEDNTKNIEFLRGTSNVTTSENYLPETGWIIPEPLKNVTGLWIDTSTYDLSNKPDNVLDIVYIVENGTAL